MTNLGGVFKVLFRHIPSVALLTGLFLSFPAKAQDNELEVILYRAPAPLDWSTPGALTRSTWRNTWSTYMTWVGSADREGSEALRANYQFYPHSISHVNIKLQCAGEEPVYRGKAGTKASSSYLWDLFLERQGLDAMVTPTPGRFFKNDEILAVLPTFKDLGYVRSLQLVLTPRQCQHLKGYLEKYSELGMDQIYGGLVSDPRRGQGSGCAAFATSFLEILGLPIEKFDQQWTRTLRIPRHLIATENKRSSLSFSDFLNGKDSHWATASEEGVPIQFWDPELIYNWITPNTVLANRKEKMSFVQNQDSPFSMIRWDVRSFERKMQPYFVEGEDRAREVAAWTRGNLDQWIKESEIPVLSNLKARQRKK